MEADAMARRTTSDAATAALRAGSRRGELAECPMLREIIMLGELLLFTNNDRAMQLARSCVWSLGFGLAK